MRQQHASNREALGGALLRACLAGDQPAAERLLELGADARFYDPAFDADPLIASARSGSLALLERLLLLCPLDPGDSSLEDALAESLGAGAGLCACALIEAGASLEAQGLERAISAGRVEALQTLIERGHLRRERRRGPAPAADEDPAWDPFAPLLELGLLLSAQLAQREIFLALLAAGPGLRGPMAQKTGQWVAAAAWPDAASHLLSAGFRPQGKTLSLWRESLAAPLLAFEERRALSRRSRPQKKASPESEARARASRSL